MKSRFFLLAAAALLAGCDSDPASPNTIGASGSVTFSYTGAGASSATTFSAVGAVPADLAGGTNEGFGSTAWASGGVDNTNNTLDIGAAVPRSSSTWDLVVISINRKTVGTSTISPSCTGTDCLNSVSVSFGTTTSDEPTMLCTIVSGTVTISTIDASKATGTFSGTGICASSTGTESIFTVSSGSFNVGLLATVPGVP